MKPWAKATIYVTLAALVPIGEMTAVMSKNKVWPDQFELVAVAVAAFTAAIISLKGYYSDPNTPPKV